MLMQAVGLRRDENEQRQDGLETVIDERARAASPPPRASSVTDVNINRHCLQPITRSFLAHVPSLSHPRYMVLQRRFQPQQVEQIVVGDEGSDALKVITSLRLGCDEAH
jgi:hypothetical protein